MNIYDRIIQEHEKCNPYTATGIDLDNIGKCIGLKREFTECLESDREFRIKILEELNKYFQEGLTLEDLLWFTNNLK